MSSQVKTDDWFLIAALLREKLISREKAEEMLGFTPKRIKLWLTKR
jgi:hypothetical protein